MNAYLVAYEYGNGRVWGYVTAESHDHVEDRLPEVDVYQDPPRWMTVDEVASMRNQAIPVTAANCLDRLLDRRIED